MKKIGIRKDDKNMERLTWKSYKDSDSILFIDLHNGYSVVALKIWNQQEKFYNVEFRLKENTTDKWDLIEEVENVEFMTNYKIINSAILKWVSTHLEDGFFDKYINRYIYEMNCFEKGNEFYERNRLG